MAGLDTGLGSEDLEWLVRVLWPSAVRTRVARRGTGDARAERYLIVPSARRPRFLVPIDRTESALASLLLYNRLRPWSTRAARRLLAEAVRSHAARLFARDVLVVEDETPLGPSLAEVFARDDLDVAVGIPPRGPNRKPVLQVFTRAGAAVGYVKVGWNDVTRARVEREAEALGAWADHGARIARVPRLLHSGDWRDARISVTAPLPPDARAYPASQGPALGALRDVLGLGPRESQTLDSSPYVDGLRARTSYLEEADEARAAAVGAVLDDVARRARRGDALVGVGHGDWTPWNLARSRDRIYVFDWEHWTPQAPVGLDVLHWFFQVFFVTKKKDVRESFLRAATAARTGVIALGVAPATYEMLLRLYLAEIALRAAEGVVGGAPLNPRFHAPVLALLRSAAAGDL